MPIDRRNLLRLALVAGMAPAYARHALAADTPRFHAGHRLGHPRPDGMVLWTRLIGDDLPARVPVRWEVAEDEAFSRVVAGGEETAEAAWAHSVHAEPSGLRSDRWYWYRFSALGQRSPAGRTRTAPAPDADASLRFAIASCQRWDHGHYAAWRHMADDELDLVMFLGDYIYEYAGVPAACARTGAARRRRSPVPRRATRSTRATRRCRRRTRRRRGCWCGTTTRSRTTTRPARQRAGPGLRGAARRARTRRTGSTSRSRRRGARRATTRACTRATTGAASRASTRSTTASTATRRCAPSRAAAAATR
jgi:hypothetical protein